MTPTPASDQPTDRRTGQATARSSRRRGAAPARTVAAAAAATTVALAVSVALAQPTWASETVLAQAASVQAVLTNIRGWLMGILALLATVFLTIGGIRYVMAGGDPGEVEKSKTAFRAAGIGYALAALAPVVVAVLEEIVQV